MTNRIRPRLWNRTDPDRPRKCISIMRPALVGNPFVVGVDGNRAECITKYEAWLREQWFLPTIGMLDDVDLVCCCSPMPCHGDVILKIWDELNR